MVTSSPTFERIVEGLGLTRRARQDVAVDLAREAIDRDQVAIIQAPTGVGKSFVALATAADHGKPGEPGVVITTTNELAAQYLSDCRKVARVGKFTYARVMGRAHYACADSDAAQAQHVASAKDVEKHEGYDNTLDIRRERDQWLEALRTGPSDPASRWELESLGLGDDKRYACPGYPDCSGVRLGGCGAKRARQHSFTTDVVITNYHVLAYAHRLRGSVDLIPEPKIVVADEAHKMPSVLAGLDGGTLTPGTGAQVFAEHREVRAAIGAFIKASLASVKWGRSVYDTEARVRVDLASSVAFSQAYQALPEYVREEFEKEDQDDREDDEEPSSLDVLTLLRNFIGTLGESTWLAWTTRYRWDGEWRYTGEIHLRRVDASEHMVPVLIPAGALLSGTFGSTFPRRAGLGHLEIADLGQEFNWSRVHGFVSNIPGVKTGPDADQRARTRAEELAGRIAHHRGALVLVNAHLTDKPTVAAHLSRLLPRHRLFVQPDKGGSIAAGLVRAQYVDHLRNGGRGVLIGTDSYATGVDLRGDLCTFVAWWVCHEGKTSIYDLAVKMHYRPVGDYVQEMFRTRIAQGFGRLLRTPTDTGEVMLCDSRGAEFLEGCNSTIDNHLTSITWQLVPQMVLS